VYFLHQVYLYISLSNILASNRSVMEDPYTELTRAIIKLKEEIVELQDAIHNLYALAETML